MDDLFPNPFLLAGGALSALAALLHLGCIRYGAPWYRFFGAGERMARLAEAGSPFPTRVTLGITLVLGLFALYAFCAGLGRPLPLSRLALGGVAAVYLLRGVAGLALIPVGLGRSPAFWLWSSLICLTLGGLHLAGLLQAWPAL
ncbi:hypothetical protein FBY21_0762 [Pseudomonas sp. SLBN-26]|uniref:hypothetical protein n=1 Tax=Pseudomonadaceae TaxID=135621 RepID=UPI00115364B6|nr:MULTISPECIES: hypothetical protein [Pseudomonas]MCP1616150.1 hypothetical protein [Pseudomonas otitidis]MDU9396912.1 hypothetical protein [Pseudomonas sp. zfem003]TQL05414.1 hypothetical protein FBY21_0762 [Pseudomonas sp. SLBN-26]